MACKNDVQKVVFLGFGEKTHVKFPAVFLGFCYHFWGENTPP